MNEQIRQFGSVPLFYLDSSPQSCDLSVVERTYWVLGQIQALLLILRIPTQPNPVHWYLLCEEVVLPDWYMASQVVLGTLFLL